MENLFMYLLNRKPTKDEKQKYKHTNLKEINKIIINTEEYTNFLENQKESINLLIRDKLNINEEIISPIFKEKIFHKMLDLKRNNKFSNRKITDFLNTYEIILKKYILLKLGVFAEDIFENYEYIGEVKYKYLENMMVFKLKQDENLEKCYEYLIWKNEFIDFVEKSIDKSL